MKKISYIITASNKNLSKFAFLPEVFYTSITKYNNGYHTDKIGSFIDSVKTREEIIEMIKEGHKFKVATTSMINDKVEITLTEILLVGNQLRTKSNNTTIDNLKNLSKRLN